LDNFAELSAELSAELQLRRKQYEFYRDKLLTFENITTENRKMKDIADIYLGLTYTPNYVENGITFLSSQNISKDYLDLCNVKYISKDEFDKSTANAKPKKGDILFTRVGSNLGHPTIVDTDIPLCIFVSLGFLRVKEGVCNRYIKHWMNTEMFWNQVRAKTQNIPKANLNTGWMREFDISIPPLEIQTKIADVLDNFDKICSDLGIGLPAEIEARQKQYEYYRKKLLTFDKQAGGGYYLSDINLVKLFQYVYGFVNVRLGDVIKVCRGVRLIKSQLSECEGFPVYQNSMKPLGYYDKSNCYANTTFVIAAGAAGEIGFSDVAFWAADDCYFFNVPDDIKSKFLYYSLLSHYDLIQQKVRRASVPRISRADIENIVVSIPQLEKQKEIVEILDKFDTIINDISKGLPAEIETRQKQYEYYREKLLNFKRKN